MSRNEFEKAIEENDMYARFYTNGAIEVGKKEFANPLLFFKESDRGSNYQGHVNIKIINSRLFGPIQIAIALEICHRYLSDEL